MIIIRDTERELEEAIEETGRKVIWKHIYDDNCVASVEDVPIKPEKKEVSAKKNWGMMKYVGSSIAYMGEDSRTKFGACNAKLMTKEEAEHRCEVLNKKYKQKIWKAIKLK